MDNLDTKSPSTSGTNELQAQYDALRHLVVSMLILVVVISATLNLYLLRQWRSTSRDLDAIRPQAAQMVRDYQTKTGPLMNDFVSKLAEYGRTHPDFLPILAKYNLKPATNAPAATPAPKAPKK
jgi:hypothetical protein